MVSGWVKKPVLHCVFVAGITILSTVYSASLGPAENACLPKFHAAVQFYLDWGRKSLIRDIDRDGRSDFILFLGCDGIHIHMSRETRAFTEIFLEDPSCSTTGEAGDFNGDGFPDIVSVPRAGAHPPRCGTETAPFILYAGKGRNGAWTEEFAPPEEIMIPAEPQAMGVKDLDNDGTDDLLILSVCRDETEHLQAKIFVLPGRTGGGSAFGEPIEIPKGKVAFDPTNRDVEFRFGELNGDGKCDFIIWQRYEDIEVYLSNGEGEFSFRNPITIPQPQRTYWNSCDIRDVNQDEIEDIVVWTERDECDRTAPPPQAWVPELHAKAFLGDPDGRFPLYGGNVPFLSGSNMLFSDFDRDGVVDLIHICRDALFFRRGDVDPQTGQISFLYSGLGFHAGSHPVKLQSADFDGDGFPDLAARSFFYDDPEVPAGGFSILFNEGAPEGENPRFRAARTLRTLLPPMGVIAGDFNGDGLVDIAFSHEQGDIAASEDPVPEGYGVFLQEEASNEPVFEGPVFYKFGEGPYGLEEKDFCEGDSAEDVDGPGICDPSFYSPLTEEYDVNGDGFVDKVFVLNNSTCPTCPSVTHLFVLLNHCKSCVGGRPQSTQQVTAHWALDVADGTKGIAAADFNNDGITDLAVGGFFSHLIVVLPGESSCHGKEVFLRGDVNSDFTVDLSDAISLLLHLFAGGEIRCAEAADANANGHTRIGDVVYLLTHLFSGGPPPPSPFPFYGPCE